MDQGNEALRKWKRYVNDLERLIYEGDQLHILGPESPVCEETGYALRVDPDAIILINAGKGPLNTATVLEFDMHARATVQIIQEMEQSLAFFLIDRIACRSPGRPVRFFNATGS